MKRIGRRTCVHVDCEMNNLADWSVLGDRIGKQVRPDWDMPYGPMPYIIGPPAHMSFASKKALTAAAANYGCAMLWAEGHTVAPPLQHANDGSSAPEGGWQGELTFTEADLQQRYEALAPKGQVDLVVIGCPQASLEELRITASALRFTWRWAAEFPTIDCGCSPAARITNWRWRTGRLNCLRKVERSCSRTRVLRLRPTPLKVQPSAHEFPQSRTLPHQRLESLANLGDAH